MLQSNFQFPGQTNFYQGKVRDVYTINDEHLVMIVSDRISAFDVVLPKPIPYKGQVLNQIAAIMLESTKDIVPNWVEQVPLPNLTIGKKCEPFPVEMVIRGNLTGHAWRVYKTGERKLCGVTLPDNMRENDFFTDPIITPTTKAHEGHDEDISREEIIAQGLVSADDYEKLELYTRRLFERGRELAEHQGLILVDTKYEFGKIGDEIYLIDEVHTPDSSRYFYKDTYEANQEAGVPQHQLSKEFVREWLMSKGFQGKAGEVVPEMPDDFIASVSERYIELYEKIIGDKFQKREVTPDMVEDVVVKTLEKM